MIFICWYDSYVWYSLLIFIYPLRLKKESCIILKILWLTSFPRKTFWIEKRSQSFFASIVSFFPHRSQLMTLISQNIIFPHFLARDILEVLISKKINQSEDFFWLRQLRYYSIDDRISVSMVDTTINFGYEYLGNTPILVITPLTDRCYRYQMMSLSST